MRSTSAYASALASCRLRALSIARNDDASSATVPSTPSERTASATSASMKKAPRARLRDATAALSARAIATDHPAAIAGGPGGGNRRRGADVRVVDGEDEALHPPAGNARGGDLVRRGARRACERERVGGRRRCGRVAAFAGAVVVAAVVEKVLLLLHAMVGEAGRRLVDASPADGVSVRRERDRGEDGDDRQRHEKFDQREAAPRRERWTTARSAGHRATRPLNRRHRASSRCARGRCS